MQLLNYFRDVIKEVKNVDFPSYKDVKLTSVIILILLLLFMMFISFSDFIISKLIRIFLGII